MEKTKIYWVEIEDGEPVLRSGWVNGRPNVLPSKG